MLNTSVVDSNWRDRIGTVHSYLYKQFRIALSADRDGDHGYFNVSGKISEIDAVRAMNFFISSPDLGPPKMLMQLEKKMLKHELTKQALGNG